MTGLGLPEPRDEAQRALYETILGGPRAAEAGHVPIADESGRLLGPFGIMLLAPETGEAVQELGAALRFRSELDPVVREAAILLVASHRDCRFEWRAHEPAARRAGLDDRQIDALRNRRVPGRLDAASTIALEAVVRMLGDEALDGARFRAAAGTVGERRLAELVWLCGYYSMLALALAVFDPPGLPE